MPNRRPAGRRPAPIASRHHGTTAGRRSARETEKGIGKRGTLETRKLRFYCRKMVSLDNAILKVFTKMLFWSFFNRNDFTLFYFFCPDQNTLLSYLFDQIESIQKRQEAGSCRAGMPCACAPPPLPQAQARRSFLTISSRICEESLAERVRDEVESERSMS